MPDFYFNPKTQRYHYSSGAGRGQFVPASAVRFMMAANIEQTQKDIRTIGELLRDGKISLATWEETTAIALKNLHVQSYLLGRGGKSTMRSRDYGLVGQRLRKEYQYLRKFAEEIRTKGVSEAEFFRRINLYVSAGSGLYEKAREEGHIKADYSWERRLRTKTESCSSCILYESQGWVPISTLPAPTERCECKSSCGCYKEYAKEKPRDFIRRFGWLDSGEHFSRKMQKSRGA